MLDGYGHIAFLAKTEQFIFLNIILISKYKPKFSFQKLNRFSIVAVLFKSVIFNKKKSSIKMWKIYRKI